MFGKPNSKKINNIKINNINLSSNLDIPVSFGKQSNKDFVDIKKKEKEKRISDKIKSEKCKIISYYIKIFLEYKKKKTKYENELDNLINNKSNDINRVIRLFRFNSGYNNDISSNISKYLLIIDIIFENYNNKTVLEDITLSNLFYIFRNCLILIFLDNVIFQIDTNTKAINLVNDILDYITNVNNKNEIKKRYFFNMILNNSMVDVLLLKYIEKYIINRNNNFSLFTNILSVIFDNNMDIVVECTYYTFGNDLFINIFKNQRELKKKIKSNNIDNISNLVKFINNRNSWFKICMLLLLVKGKNLLGYCKCINLFKNKLKYINFNYFLSLIMNESINSIKYINESQVKSNNRNDSNVINNIVPKSLFSYLLLNYMLIECYNERKYHETNNYGNNIRLFNTNSKEFNKTLFLINIWDFNSDLDFDFDSNTNDRCCSLNHDLNMNIDIDYHDSNCDYNDENIKYIRFFVEMLSNEYQDNNVNVNINFEDNIKILLFIRLHLLFANLIEKFTYIGTFILGDNIYHNKKYDIYEIINVNVLENNKVISKLLNNEYILNNIIKPLLDNILLLMDNKLNIEIVTNIINLLLDIYFPLNALEKPKILNFESNNKKSFNSIKSATDICTSGNIISRDKLVEKVDDIDLNLITSNIYCKVIKINSELLNMDLILLNNKYLYYLDNNNDDSILLERIYNKYYIGEYYSIDVFFEQLKKGRIKFISEINDLILNHLVYDTKFVLVLFLLIQNNIVLNYKGNITNFIVELIQQNRFNFTNIVNYFGITLNHQLLYSDEIEIIKSLNQMNDNNNNNNHCHSNQNSFKRDVNYFVGNSIISFDNNNGNLYLDLSIALNELDNIINSKKNNDVTLVYGSEVLKLLLDRLTYKNLNDFITYKRYNDAENNSNNLYLLINMNKNRELIYISLFINNLSFELITRNTTMSCLNSIYGELSSRIYQMFIKLNYNSIKLDDLYSKIPWTILSISDLLKPKNILLKQAINIEFHGNFPMNNHQNNNGSHFNYNESDDNETEDNELSDDYYYNSELFNLMNNNLNYGINQNMELESEYIYSNSHNNANNVGNCSYKYSRDENKIDLVKIFDSTIKYVSNKSKYKLLKKIIKELSYLLNFEDRLCFYYHYISELKYKYYYQPENIVLIPKFEIRRSHLIEDGYFSIGNLDPFRLRSVFRIVFLDENGEMEAGIDGGGLLKDFIICISRELCSPEFGLFINCKDNTLAPRDYYSLIEIINNTNNNSNLNIYKCQNLIKYSNINVLNLYEFLGKIVGKAIYEKILLEIEFNPVFLNSVFGHYSDFNDLANFDNEIYKNLLFIKNYGNDLSDLSITFSLTINLNVDILNSNNTNNNYIEIDLIPNGRNITVNNENRLLYIKILTRYKLITSIKLQSNAFLKGLSTVIPYESLKLFLPYEIQSLISGVYQKIDIINLKSYTTYTGYLETSPQIIWFWEIIEKFSLEEQSEFLLFVTASRKAPLLGFQYLNPNFGIQIVPDSNRLPSASTCFNLLKLPTYTSKDVLEKKLKQAIFNSRGFDLS
ncbi:E3A like HECT domain containing ubiquitin ligase [Cryptosporidium xiaoi]|uniref:HECT-type E3 ubiquitin transferase n=1 Tax=Cryptosporidium xiaoi TaxID=659607 RepID=A0AAV9YDU0_9CRYT